MHTVLCPHCNAKIKHDGSRAGQVVSCPRCRGQMQLQPPPPPQPLTADDPFAGIDDGNQPLLRRSRRRKANPSLAWIIIPGLLLGLIGGIAAGIYEAGSKDRGMAAAVTIGAALLMALAGALLGVVLWGLAKLHRGLAYGAVGVVVVAWLLFVAYDRMASRGQPARQDDRQDRIDAAETLSPNPALEKALSDYESACDELAGLYAKERLLKATHRDKEQWRKGAMDLAANAGDFDQVKRLTDQAIEESREMQKLSDQILAASGKAESRGRSLTSLLEKDLKKIETLPAGQQKEYLERHERWQERQQRAFEKARPR